MMNAAQPPPEHLLVETACGELHPDVLLHFSAC